MVDALAEAGDEGRGKAALSLGEPQAGIDPGISEWGNPRGQNPRTAR
jgi:hypothetical protein